MLTAGEPTARSRPSRSSAPRAGERVSVLRTGKIVVGRYTGIVSLANTIGYGRWSTAWTATVVGGAISWIATSIATTAAAVCCGIHELGHALGYQHVKSRTSIMNPAVGPEPTEFDRSARSSPSSVRREIDRRTSTRRRDHEAGGVRAGAMV